MTRKFILFLVLIVVIIGCEKTSEFDKYYKLGIRAEHQLQYDKAISYYAKALQYNREAPSPWYAKGRCHLLLLMQTALTDSATMERNIKISSNLSKARECFKRSEQWGLIPSAEVDSIQVRLERRFRG